MRWLPVHSMLWSIFLFVWASNNDSLLPKAKAEAENPDVCPVRESPGETSISSSVEKCYVEIDAVWDKFSCLLYATNVLNCSWSFSNLTNDAQLSVQISICDDETLLHSLYHPSEEKVGSWNQTLRDDEALYVIIQFNVTLHDRWTVYFHEYEMEMLEVLPPPRNISASIKDRDLLVTWALPYSRINSKPSCFEYELDLGDQERPKHLEDKLSYTELEADPRLSYRVRMRTRIVNTCPGSPQWSEWSPALTVEQTPYLLNTPVIVLITLGIPMILLALLLLLRYQRVSKILFPPIPRPPPKYKYILEKIETFSFFLPDTSAEPAEEMITVVEYVEQNNRTRSESEMASAH